MSALQDLNLPKDVFSDEDDEEENDMNYNIEGAHTDVEDMDEDERGPHTKKSSPVVHKDEFLTDVEDYNVSDAEDSDSDIPFPETMVSLQQFLDQGCCQEETDLGNGNKEKVGRKMKKGKFSIQQSFDTENDVDTESEDYLASRCDSEDDIISNAGDLNDILPETNKLSISDGLTEIHHKTDSESSSESDDVSGACGGLSEIEDLFVSEKEEIFECDSASSIESDPEYEYPIIDVAFVTEGKVQSKRSAVKLPHYREDVLTDIEGMDFSAAESISSSEDSNVIPTARVLPRTISRNESDTDLENLDIDITDPQEIIHAVSPNYFPLPLREKILVKENQNGDPETNVFPLEETFVSGVYNNYSNIGNTDTEDCSGIDDSSSGKAPSSYSLHPNCIESEYVENSESLKVVKKQDFAFSEQVTDTEELFIDGTAHRKKLKGRGKPKSSRLMALGAKDEIYSENVTDVEDLDLSDFDFKVEKKIVKPENKEKLLDEAFKTDVEYLTAEEDLEEHRPADAQINLDPYFSSTLTVESVSQPGGIRNNRHPSPVLRLPLFPKTEETALCLTDVEDVNLPSDCEEVFAVSRSETPPPIEMSIYIAEISTVVHDSTTRLFDIEKERKYIKGMKDVTEAVTDVEYVDEDPLVKGDSD